MIIKLHREGMLSLARPPLQVPGALGAFRRSAPPSSYAYSGDSGQRWPCWRALGTMQQLRVNYLGMLRKFYSG